MSGDVLDWPSELVPNETEYHLQFVTRQFESPFNGAAQTLEFPGAKWTCVMRFNHMTRDKMRHLEVFLLRLRGAAGRVRIPDHAIKRQGAGSNSKVDGAGQTGRRLLIKDAPASVDYLLAGDYFEIGGELKRAISDTRTDGLGRGVVLFEPALRRSPATNQTVNVVYPCAVMRLEKDDGSSVKRVPMFGSVSLSFVEDVYR